MGRWGGNTYRREINAYVWGWRESAQGRGINMWGDGEEILIEGE